MKPQKGMSMKTTFLLTASLGCLLSLCGIGCGQTDSSELPDGEPPASYRTWQDTTGRYSIEAAMVGYENGTVELKRRDGSTVAVELNKLSEGDREWVRRELARRRRAARQASEPTVASSWPGWRGPWRNGKSPDTGLMKQWAEEGPPLVWKATGIGKGFSSVAVANDTVYITGDDNNRLLLSALDLSGQPKWQIEVDAAWSKSHPGSRSTPTIDGDRLYLLSGNGLLVCLDAKTGRKRWEVRMQEFGGRVPGWGYAESVLILDQMAVVTPGGNSCIVALDKMTGRPLWRTEGVQAQAQYSSCYPFQFANEWLIVNGTRAGLVCVEARTGRLQWTNPFSADNTANCPTPVYEDGYVFWANGYGKGGICLRLEKTSRGVSAEEAWRTRDMVCHHGGYIIHEGFIYGNHSNGWVCLDLKTGEKRWQERGVGKGSLCFADGMLYLFGERNGQVGLATCSPDGMEMKGSFQVEGEGPSWAHPVVIGGRLYIRYDTNLYCYDVRAR